MASEDERAVDRRTGCLFSAATSDLRLGAMSSERARAKVRQCFTKSTLRDDLEGVIVGF